jgi:hypothetical protein
MARKSRKPYENTTWEEKKRMRKTLPWIALGMILMLVLVFCVQGVRSVETEKYKLSKLFSGIAVPVESYIQPEYVQGPVYASPLEVFNAFEATCRYGDDDFRVVNGRGEFIEGFQDTWMTTKMSEMFRTKYGYLVGDCDCLAINLCSWFIKSGFKAYVVIGTITLFDNQDPAAFGTFQHAWVKVFDPSTKLWYLAESVLEMQVDELKEYYVATVNYRTFWQFNNTGHSWGPTTAFFSKHPKVTVDQLAAIRNMYVGN